MIKDTTIRNEIKLQITYNATGLQDAVYIQPTDSEEEQIKKVRQIIIELMSMYEQDILGDCLCEALNEFDVRVEGFAASRGQHE